MVIADGSFAFVTAGTILPKRSDSGRFRETLRILAAAVARALTFCLPAPLTIGHKTRCIAAAEKTGREARQGESKESLKSVC